MTDGPVKLTVAEAEDETEVTAGELVPVVEVAEVDDGVALVTTAVEDGACEVTEAEATFEEDLAPLPEARELDAGLTDAARDEPEATETDACVLLHD